MIKLADISAFESLTSNSVSDLSVFNFRATVEIKTWDDLMKVMQLYPRTLYAFGLHNIDRENIAANKKKIFDLFRRSCEAHPGMLLIHALDNRF